MLLRRLVYYLKKKKKAPLTLFHVCSGLAGYVHQYNSLNSQPDVLKSLYSPLQPSSSLEGLR
jgi:hypothetical protein